MAEQHIISAKGAVITVDVNMLIKRLFTAIIRPYCLFTMNNWILFLSEFICCKHKGDKS